MLGMIGHSLFDEKYITKNEICNVKFKVDTCRHIHIPTIVPYHLWHWDDFMPFCLNNATKKCECGEGSLYKQRARGWDLTRQRFLFNYLNCVKKCKRWWVKFLFIVEFLQVISDWVALFYIIIICFIYGRWSDVGRSIFISLCWSIPFVFFITIKKVNKCYLFISIFFVPLYKFVLSFFIKIDAMLYTFFIYSNVKNPLPLYMQNDIQKKLYKFFNDDNEIFNANLRYKLTSL